jgi:DegV family protein with EDD domain
MEERITIVTDSTADLPVEIVNKYNINVIPLKILFGNKEYRDGIDLNPDEFYEKLKISMVLPTTSQPSPADFTQLYNSLLEQYTDIISIHLSSGLSSTVNSARLAGDQFSGRVHVFDSKSISLGIGLLVTEAAKSIREGWKVPEILKKISLVRKNSELLFTLNTLEYLSKGGRIGKVSSLLGSVLNIKPIVRVNEEGIYTPYNKTRTQKKALEAIEKGLEKLANGRRAVNFAVAHGSAQEAADKLKTGLEKLFNMEASICTKVGPVIGVHTGPGTVGAAVWFE